MSLNKIAIVILFIEILFAQQDLFDLILLSQARGASCLDGSPPAIYIHEGQGKNKTNFLLYFEPGGFCGKSTPNLTFQLCYNRSLTDLGSSKNYPSTISRKHFGVASPQKQQNPLFYDWTLVIVKYCDGHGYIGYRKYPVEYKDKYLYFRGSRNVKEVFYYLNEKYDLYNSGKIVISGSSAGSLCASQWVNYLADHAKKAKVYVIADAALFIVDYFSDLLHEKHFREHIQTLMDFVFNSSETPQPVKKCLRNPDFDMANCMNIVNYISYIKVPLFIIESPYDAYSMQNFIGTACIENKIPPYSLQNCNSTERAKIEDYRQNQFNPQNSQKIKRNT